MAAAREVMRTWRPISRLLRYNYGIRSFASVELDQSKPEPPNGFLFNEKPLLPGERRQKEEWEVGYIIGIGFSTLIVALILWKPATSVNSQDHQTAIAEKGRETTTEMTSE